MERKWSDSVWLTTGVWVARTGDAGHVLRLHCSVGGAETPTHGDQVNWRAFHAFDGVKVQTFDGSGGRRVRLPS